MNTWKVDFNGSCVIKAESKLDAIHKFWEFINADLPLPCNYYDVENAEETEE